MTQLTLISKRLSTKRGISAERLSRLTGVSQDSVYKRIHDLRKTSRIIGEERKVKGAKVTFYRYA